MHSRRISILSLVTFMAASFLLSGCMLAPGHHLDESELSDGKDAAGLNVKLIPITPKLIMDEDRARPPVVVPAELVNYKPDSYTIGPSDVLYVTVWDHPELTTPSGSQQQIESNGRLVRPNGEFFFPYIGNIKAEGMTIEGLASYMTQELSKYLDKPQLDVAVIRYSSKRVYLSGAFKNTTPISLNSKPLTLVEAVGIGGVDTELVDLSDVKLTRDGREYKLDFYSLNRDSAYTSKIFLKDGDNVHLNYNDNKRIFVLGEVLSPQSLVFRADHLSLSDALASVGGLDEQRANGKGVYVIRGAADMENEPAKIYQLDAKAATGLILANRFHLQPQDVVYVGPTDIARWNRVVEELLPTLDLINNGSDAIQQPKIIKDTY
jgi:polysaccharide export outer membrane protein